MYNDIGNSLLPAGENMLREEALAKKLADLNPEAFWREIRNINNCNTPLPSSIESVSCGEEIVDL